MKTYYFIIIGLGALAIFLAGATVDRFYLTKSEKGIANVTLPTETVPTLNIEKIGNGKLGGVVTGGEVRVVAGENVVNAEDAQITLDLGDSLVNTEQNAVPDWAQFVASKNGKKYYALGSAMAQRLAPENRVYFATAEEAEKAGYKK